MTVSCAGERFDPLTSDSTLLLQVLQSAAEKIDYSYDPDAAEPNRAVVRIKPA